MNKQIAADIFGNQTALGVATGRHRSTISNWPDKLTQQQTDEVIGAAIRLRKDIDIPNVVLFYKEDYV